MKFNLFKKSKVKQLEEYVLKLKEQVVQLDDCVSDITDRMTHIETRVNEVLVSLALDYTDCKAILKAYKKAEKPTKKNRGK